MRRYRYLLLFAIFVIPSAPQAQSVSHLTVTNNGSVGILAGNFDGDGGGDIVGEDSDGNLNCVPSDGGKYDMGVIVSPIQFPGPTAFTTAAMLKAGATDYIILGGAGIVNVYSSSGCTFTLTQSLIIQGTPTDVFVTPPATGTGVLFVTITSAVAGQTGFTFFSQIFQNSEGTFSPGPAGLGPGAEGFAAGSSIAIANFVEPQPPGPLATLSVSLWTFANGAWTNTPSFVPPGIPMGFVTAPNTKALYLVSHDLASIYMQQVDPSSGAASAPVTFTLGSEGIGMVAFGSDSFAIPLSDSVQIFQDSSGNGIWAPLGGQIIVAVPGSQNHRSWVGIGATLPGGFVLQSPDETATAFTVTNGAMVSAPTSLAFPSTAPGSSSSLPVTITNTGNEPLNVTGGEFTGTNAADFSQTNDCIAVAPAASCTATVVFSPSTLSAENATLALESNADNSPTDVTLTSAPAPAPVVSVSAAGLDFGSVIVNSSVIKTLTIGNSGDAPLNSLAVQVSGQGFTLTNPCPASLAVLAQCTVTVTFSPTATGSASGMLMITSNVSPVNVTLQGSGSPAPAVTATPPALSTTSGGTATAQIAFSNFATTPTITASCQIPAGVCAIQNNSELVVTTTPRSSTIAPTVRRFDWPWSANVLLVAMVVMMMAPRRRRIALALAGAIILAACGGGGAPVVTGTPAGSYKVVVTGTAGSVSQSVTVPVTVN